MRTDYNLTFLLRHISYLKFTYLEYAIHWLFSIFTELSSHHYNLIQKIFITPKKKSCTCLQSIPHPNNLSPRHLSRLSLDFSMNLPILGILYKQNHNMCLLCLISFIQYVFKIHSYYSMYQSFSSFCGCIIVLYMNIPYFIHYLVDLGCFHFVVIMNNTALYTDVSLFVWRCFHFSQIHNLGVG